MLRSKHRVSRDVARQGWGWGSQGTCLSGNGGGLAVLVLELQSSEPPLEPQLPHDQSLTVNFSKNPPNNPRSQWCNIPHYWNFILILSNNPTYSLSLREACVRINPVYSVCCSSGLIVQCLIEKCSSQCVKERQISNRLIQGK